MHLLIRSDGTEIDLGPGPLSRAAVMLMLDAASMSVVSLQRLGSPPHVMLVDDMAVDIEFIDQGDTRIDVYATRARKPVNEKATSLYWSGTLQPDVILGDALVMPADEELLP